MPRSVLTLLALTLVCITPAPAQKKSPVSWTVTADPATAPPGGSVTLRLSGHVDEGYHIYSLTTPKGGPLPTKILMADQPAVAGFRVFEPTPQHHFDSTFNLDTELYEKSFDFLVPVAIKADAAAGPAELAVQIRYQACNATECLPSKKTLTAQVTIQAGAATAAFTPPAGYLEANLAAVAPAAAVAPLGVVPASASGSAQSQNLFQFALLAFGFGLAAIFTPCVFPMIPITVSYFLNQQSATRAESVKQAVVFCLGIVGLFTALGLGVTAIAGPFGVVQLGSNPWVNLFIAGIFFVFALSLLGAFEITLPSSLLTSLDKASQKGGFGGTLLMGLTFSLTSFACVGPFVGPLLASSVQGAKIQPTVGMASFASGLAMPFFFLAVFPSYLSRLPRSGGWLARVKTVLGFVLLAAMLKYLSNIDQVLQWNVLTRDRFLAAWFVLFLLPGLYLLGFLRLEGVKPDERLGLGRMLSGAAFLIFAVSLLPGMFGGRLGEIEGAIPLAAENSVSSGSASNAPGWMKNQYSEALAKAKAENKLVLVNFTGYACTNCHWMKANMFPRASVAEALQGLVLLELYTDGTDDVSVKNQELQEKLFQTVSIPYYAVLDGDGKVLASFAGSTRDEPQFVAFLKTKGVART